MFTTIALGGSSPTSLLPAPTEYNPPRRNLCERLRKSYKLFQRSDYSVLLMIRLGQVKRKLVPVPTADSI